MCSPHSFARRNRVTFAALPRPCWQAAAPANCQRHCARRFRLPESGDHSLQLLQQMSFLSLPASHWVSAILGQRIVLEVSDTGLSFRTGRQVVVLEPFLWVKDGLV